MRHILLIALLLVFSNVLNAQIRRPIYGNNTRTTNLRLGPEIGFAAGDFDNTHNFGTGVSAVLDIPINAQVSVIGNVQQPPQNQHGNWLYPRI